MRIINKILLLLVVLPISAYAVNPSYDYYYYEGEPLIFYGSVADAFNQGDANDYCASRYVGDYGELYASVDNGQSISSFYNQYRCQPHFIAKTQSVKGVDCDEGQTFNLTNGSCESTIPDPPPNPTCDEGEEYSDNYGLCVPNCGTGQYWDIGAMACLNEEDCPEQVNDRAADLTVHFGWETKCANGCQAEWWEKEGVSNLRSGQGVYLYNGLNCSATDTGGGQECTDQWGDVIACGDNPDNDDPTTGDDPGEEEKPPADDGGDPHEDDHGGSDPLEPDDAKCDALQEVYYDSSDPLQIEPSQIYFDCDKVHDTAEPNPDDEPAECAELDIWEWSSTNPYSTPPPPEYDECPSRVDDTSPLAEEEDSLCRDEGQICDTQFPSGAENLCDKAPICIEEDNFQCVTLRIQWEQACQYAIEKGTEALTGLESKLGQGDLDYLKPGGAGYLPDIDVLSQLDNEGWGLSRTCPAPPTVSIMGNTFTLENAQFCTILEIIGNLMLVFTALASARMIVS